MPYFFAMNHGQISVARTAHFFTLGQPERARQLWLVCHGYAQTADEFLQNFALLDDGTRFVVAPEGTNQWYRKGFSGEVTANWMTRRFREAAIADNAGFLQTLYNQCVAQVPSDARIVFLGFSQGAATLCRWLVETRPRFHDLVLWGGLPPEDLDYGAHKKYLADKRLCLLYGASDPFLTPERLDSVAELEAKNGFVFPKIQFEGGHDIPPDALRDFLQKQALGSAASGFLD